MSDTFLCLFIGGWDKIHCGLGGGGRVIKISENGWLRLDHFHLRLDHYN